MSGIAFEAGRVGAANADVEPVKEITLPPAEVGALAVPTTAPRFPAWVRVAGWSAITVAALILAGFCGRRCRLRR